ncbi:MAG: phosphoglycerate kinase [Clostridia bacterium]|nr:phosphoglycerate kinase [Clostridia bacterium]
MNKKTIKDINVKGKKVLLRVDFNVPVIDGKITDDNRIVEAVPTIKYLLEQGASVIAMSHLGRPDGQVVDKYSLKVVAPRLAELLGQDVIMAKDVIGEDAKAKASALKPGEVLLLENLRFHAGEEENEESFCKELASLGEVYVNDAFGTAHRKHASTYGVATILKTNAVGFLIQKEIEMIVGNIENPVRPFVGILGGAKVSDKIKIISSLLDKVDTLIIGGGMAYTFLKSQGYTIGDSLLDAERIEDAKQMIETAKAKGVNLLLPVDFLVTPEFDDVVNTKFTDDQNIPDGYMGVDIGPKTRELFTNALKDAKTVIWNGPVGVFEKPEFAKGTYAVAEALTKVNGTTIIGGGDSASAVINMGLADKMTHISTGGGASLKLFEGKVLPGIDVINDN